VLSRDAVDQLPPSVANGSFAFRTLADSGARLVNGSDAPLTELDPLLGLRAAVLRTLDERPPWRPDQALQAIEVLRASTVEPAWLCGEEHCRGKLVPGQLADLVVLDRDPVACTPEELAEIGVIATMVAGRWVHNPPPWN
jgi:predicted amidohydrolase YtcJ